MINLNFINLFTFLCLYFDIFIYFKSVDYTAFHCYLYYFSKIIDM